jgi:uncharacterized RDD family membrane protein YckC
MPEESSPDLGTPRLARRMACWMYEGVLLFGVVFISGYLFSALTQTRHALDNRHWHQAFLFVVFGIYFVWFWSRGQTLAMKTWHIRIVDTNGDGVSQRQALTRYLLSYFWLIPPLLFIYLTDQRALSAMSLVFIGWVFFYALLAKMHKSRQFLHDVLARTRLVDTKPR